MPETDNAATITVHIPFLGWTGLLIPIPRNTDKRWHLRAALEIANRDGASLDGARLDGASLDRIRNDLWDILLRAQPELPALLAALREGRIDGSTYTGACACLAGTIANARHVPHTALGFANPDRPIERWFLGIGRGDTPETNQIAKITEGWIVEFQSLLASAPAGSAA